TTPNAYPGLLILSVAPDSPAAAGGLQPAHILLQVDGTPVNTPDELQAILTLKTAGDTTTLIMLVDGERQQTAVIHPSEPPYLGVDLVENWSGATALLTPTPSNDITETSEPAAAATTDASQIGLAVVNNVLPDTPAADAGLESGDVLTAVNDAAILSNAELVAQITTHKPGDTITLTFRRGPDTLTRDIILVAHPDNPEQGYLGLELLPPTP
ncbi:MAG: PDZ domain-containing protein, partial [Chloroflexi bacterium]|nr:PDZ domain-containing protein [Chloroflexota bacterium]